MRDSAPDQAATSPSEGLESSQFGHSTLNGQYKAASAHIPHTTYARIVKDENDMVGQVAYALYKQEKLKFCTASYEANQRAASAAELGVFIQAANLPSRIASYRAQAETLLEEFAEIVLEEAVETTRAQCQKEYIDRLEKAKSWARAITENLIANILAIAVSAIVLLVIWGSRVGFVPVLGDALGYEIKEKASSPASSSSKGN